MSSTSRSFFTDSAADVHPGIIELIEFELDDLPKNEIQDIINRFNIDVEASPARMISHGGDPLNNLKALYSAETTSLSFGFSDIDAYHLAFKQAIQHYARLKAHASTETSNPIPNILGVRCFSLKTMAGKSTSIFDQEIISNHKVPVHEFFTRMSSSSMGMAVLVANLGDGEILQQRLALIYQASSEENPFSVKVVGHNAELFSAINAHIETDPASAFTLASGSKIIPLNRQIAITLSKLEDPKATMEHARQAFEHHFRTTGFTPFNPPMEAVATTFASGPDAGRGYI